MLILIGKYVMLFSLALILMAAGTTLAMYGGVFFTLYGVLTWLTGMALIVFHPLMKVFH